MKLNNIIEKKNNSVKEKQKTTTSKQNLVDCYYRGIRRSEHSVCGAYIHISFAME